MIKPLNSALPECRIQIMSNSEGRDCNKFRRKISKKEEKETNLQESQIRVFLRSNKTQDLQWDRMVKTYFKVASIMKVLQRISVKKIYWKIRVNIKILKEVNRSNYPIWEGQRDMQATCKEMVGLWGNYVVYVVPFMQQVNLMLQSKLLSLTPRMVKLESQELVEAMLHLLIQVEI